MPKTMHIDHNITVSREKISSLSMPCKKNDEDEIINYQPTRSGGNVE